MDLKEFTYGILMLIIPLILIILIFRVYISRKCHNNKECMKKNLLVSMDEVSNKLKLNVDFIKNNMKPEEPQVVEGFFGGLTDWFLGSSPGNPNDLGNLNVPNDSQNKNVNPIGMDNTNGMTGNLQGDELKDAPNSDLLKSLQIGASKMKDFKSKDISTLDDLKKVNGEIKSEIDSLKPVIKKEINEKKPNNLIEPPKNIINDLKEKVQQNFSPEIITDPKLQKKEVTAFSDNPNKENTQKQAYQPQNIQSLFGNCNFYSDTCPSGYQDLGQIGLNGLESNMMLSCGNVENTKPAKAIAKIRNNGIDEIVIVDKGHGFNPSKPPGVKVIGGKGNDAQLEATIDDDGYLSLIKIIHPGYNYIETPNIIIDPPLMNSTCHFCCKK